jgi:hypothetical protein
MKQFLICANSRTGSNLIQDGIKQSKVMQTEGEALNNDRDYAGSGMGVKEFLEHLRSKCDKEYWGIKYMSWWLHGHLYLNGSIQPIFDVFDNDTKVIITDRRNYVKRAFSNMLSMESNMWWWNAKDNKEVEFRQFELKVPFIEHSHKCQMESIKLFKEFYPDILHIYYEDFTVNELASKEYRAKVVDFISDGKVELPIEQQQIYSKKTPLTRPARDYVLNIDELENKYGKGILD